jgi:copper ion binding protein
MFSSRPSISRPSSRTLVLSMIIILTLASGPAGGCGRNDDLRTEVISAKTMVCGMCEDNIEKAVYAVEGVKSVDVDLKGKTVKVQFVAAQTNLPTIERAITDAGYDANDKRRDPAAYEKLDACCKAD